MEFGQTIKNKKKLIDEISKNNINSIEPRLNGFC